MRRSKHLVRGLLGGLVLTVVLHAASAEDPADEFGDGVGVSGTDEENEDAIDWSQWTPSVAVEMGFFSHDTDNSIDFCSTHTEFKSKPLGNDCPRIKFPGLGVKSFTTPVRDNSSTTVDMASIPISFELLGPELKPLWLKPRPFVYAGYAFPREGTTQLSVASPEGLTPCSPNPGQPPCDTNAFLRSKLDWYWFAGVGMAFEFPLWDYNVQIKPAFGYLEERLKTTAEFRELARVAGSIQFIRNIQETDDSLRGIGPRLGLDVELGRRGPIAISIVSHAMLAFILNDRSFEFEKITNDGLPDPNFPLPRLRDDPWETKYDNWNVTAGIGLRFSWVGW